LTELIKEFASLKTKKKSFF